MVLYAERPVRRALQATGDVLLVLWVAVWVWAGTAVHDATMALAVPGREIDEASTSLSQRLTEAGERLGETPLVGDGLQSSVGGAGDAAARLADAGRAQVEAVETLAWWLAVAVVAVPVLLALAIHLPLRVRFVRRASAGRRLVDSGADLDLFALRALAHQPLHVLARVSDDPARAWREADPEVTRALAALELRDAGLMPRRLPGSSAP